MKRIPRRLWFLLQSALHLLARDLCESAYASYPNEAEDGFERALAEGRAGRCGYL